MIHLDGAAIAALAEEAATVAQALTRLERLQRAAVDSAPATVAQPDREIRRAGPFARPADLAAAAAQWADRLNLLARQADQAPAAAARTIREHIERLRVEMDSQERWRHDGGEDPRADLSYEKSVRNGLGGTYGDFAAAFHPGTAEAVAVLLEAVQGRRPADEIEGAAERVARTYLAARSRDDT